MDITQNTGEFNQDEEVFHQTFSASKAEENIVALYDDEKTCRDLPKDCKITWVQYFQCFADRARIIYEREGASHSWALNALLSVAFSSGLYSDKLRDDPFGPWWQSADGKAKTMWAASLRRNELRCLAMIFDKVTDSFMRAYLGDILWTYRDKWTEPKKAVRFAIIALDEYRKAPVTTQTWWACDARSQWWRAAKLAQMLEKGGKRAESVVRKLMEAVRSGEEEAEGLASEIAELLMAAHLPVGEDDVRRLDDALQKGLTRAMGEGQDGWVHGFQDALTAWKRAHAPAESLDDIHQRVGDYFFNKAQSFFREGVRPHDGRGLVWAEDAGKAYERMSKSARANAGIGQKLKELRLAVEDFRKHAELHFRTHEFELPIEPFDWGKANSLFGEADKETAICIFLQEPRISGLNEIRRRAGEITQHSLFRHIMATEFVQDGRRIGRDEPVENSGETIASETDVVGQYRLEVDLFTQTHLHPFYQCFRWRHSLVLEDFETMCRESDWVPEGHVKSMALGLFVGWEGDFWTAVSLLCPQLEASVRHRMKAAGMLTTSLQKGGLDYEAGLSNLLERQDISRVIPDETELSEMRWLFSGDCGNAYNLRNNLEHGLLADEAMTMPGLMYAWWFVWRQVFNDIRGVRSLGAGVVVPGETGANAEVVS